MHKYRISKYQIVPRQFARAGHFITDALVYLLQAGYKPIDTGNHGARLVFVDHSKCFDMIDHHVLIEGLRMHVHPVLPNWITAFLSNIT